MLILCIETGTDICSAALAKDGRMIALRESSEGRDHARKIALYVDQMLDQNDLRPDDLDAVAIGRGPGSYTGLRIGASFVKGLCYGLKIPLVAVDSLESLARCAVEEYRADLLDVDNFDQMLLCPMIDARRMEVYTELFDTRLNVVGAVEAAIVTPELFADRLSAGQRMLLFGNGADKCRGVIPDSKAVYADVLPSARGLCEVAEQRLAAGLIEDIAYFEPFYLKDFVITTSRKRLL